jgi:hypothetical protein
MKHFIASSGILGRNVAKGELTPYDQQAVLATRIVKVLAIAGG